MCVLCVLKDPRARRSGSSVLKKLLSSSGSISNVSSRSSATTKSECEAAFGRYRAFSAVPAAAAPETSEANKIDGYALHPTTLNRNILKAQYAVRGEIYNKAQELAQQGKDIIYTNGKSIVTWDNSRESSRNSSSSCSSSSC